MKLHALGKDPFVLTREASDRVVEATYHKVRGALSALIESERNESSAWLTARGMEPMRVALSLDVAREVGLVPTPTQSRPSPSTASCSRSSLPRTSHLQRRSSSNRKRARVGAAKRGATAFASRTTPLRDGIDIDDLDARFHALESKTHSSMNPLGTPGRPPRSSSSFVRFLSSTAPTTKEPKHSIETLARLLRASAMRTL